MQGVHVEPAPARSRNPWTHRDVADLVLTFQQGGIAGIEASYAPGGGVARAKEKLVELGLIEPVGAEELALKVQRDIDTFVSELAALAPRQAVLAMRATIAACRASGVLPKRKRST